ncbi:hypothetical protein [Hymenobacter gelipurpurascens]|nr:hypothetical protein [Hymenobacter gelipurpurascens]
MFATSLWPRPTDILSDRPTKGVCARKKGRSCTQQKRPFYRSGEVRLTI